ncbi:uncharacterized protein LOC117319474 [Pecten maximus]|nr:uncharacterized protein LOC117319474 [Pecten maximus]
MGHYTKVALKSCDGYNQFIQRHCIERNYIFQIRKCDLENCCSRIRNPTGVVPHFLPDPEVDPDHQGHYKSFEDVLGTPTSERDMPSGHTQTIANVAEEQQGCTNRILVAQNARKTILCEECAKPRCVYSRRALTLREERSFRRIKDRYNYTCGSLITPEGDSLHGTVFVRLQLCCTTPIEMAYYSAPAAIGRKDLCCYCASFEETERDPEALKTFRVVLPLCKPCKTAGKAVIRRQPKKF